jgi:hypothetical protein
MKLSVALIRSAYVRLRRAAQLRRGRQHDNARRVVILAGYLQLAFQSFEFRISGDEFAFAVFGQSGGKRIGETNAM